MGHKLGIAGPTEEPPVVDMFQPIWPFSKLVSTRNILLNNWTHTMKVPPGIAEVWREVASQ